MDFPSLIETIFAGALQGITELLPISSSGHLLLFSEITTFDLSIIEIAVLHLGTIVAIVIVMRDKIKEGLTKQTLLNILITMLPAGIVGLLFADRIATYLNAPWIILVSLIFWGIVLIIADWWSRNKKATITKLSEITPKHALFIGIAQVLALIPGTSRSGITIIAGIGEGMSGEIALVYSFLAGIPLLTLTGLYGLFEVVTDTTPEAFGRLAIATLVAAITGILAALLLRKNISKRILTYCGIYRIVLGIVLILLI